MVEAFRGHYVDGRWELLDGGSFTSTNPATMEPVFEARHGDGAEVDRAVAAAHRAFLDWRMRPFDERADALRRFAAALQAREERLALAITTEMGKVLHEARLEAKACVEKVRITLEEGSRLVASFSPEGLDGACHFLPLGVMAVIGPYNFPAHLANGHIVPALMTGNTIVFKPSSVTPWVGQVYAEAAAEAGFPPGVFNMLQIRRGHGDRLVAHPLVRGVLFTGSWEVGLHFKKLTVADPWKLLALEMGGKNCTIVHEDAHLEQAVQEVAMAAFLTTGQRCTGTARVIVHERLAAQFEEALVELTRRIQPGDPLGADTFMGPLASRSALKGFMDWHARLEGDSAVQTLVAPSNPKACFVTPALRKVVRYDPTHPYVREEIFGPDLSIEPVASFEEAVARACDTDYGLAFAVFTKDRSVFEEALRRVPTGVVNWNRSTTGATSRLPFGGVGKSGNHRPAALWSPYYCTYPVAELRNAYGVVKEKPCPGFPARNEVPQP